MSNVSRRSSFTEWLVQLNACAKRAGYSGPPFTQITGQQCWYADYAAGVSPEEAFKRAEQDAEEFGNYYLMI